MAENTQFDLTLAAEANVEWRGQAYIQETGDQPVNQAVFLGSTSVGGVVTLPTIKDELDLSLSLKILGGGGTNSDTPITRSSRLFGHFDRLDYGWSRANIIKDHLGVYEAFVSANFKTPRLTIFGGIYPQDSKVYPNFLNTAPCTAGNATWSCYISRSNPPDNTVWTDLFTAHIGPLVGAEWGPWFAPGLKLMLLSSTGIPPINANKDDPDSPFGKRWITTAQATWNKDYTFRGLSSSTFASVFYSNDKPAIAENDKGERTSSTDCFGISLRQLFGPLQMVLAYGFNTNQINGPEIKIGNLTQSVNLGLRYALLHDRVFLNTTFSWIAFSTHEATSLIQNRTSGNEYTGEASATVAIYDGLALTGGWRGFFTDSNAQAVIDGAKTSNSLYLFATYTHTFSWGGGTK